MKYLILFVCAFNLHSCCYIKKCVGVYLNPSFIAFSTPELDTIIFRKYKIHSNFRNPIDTLLIEPFNLRTTFTSSDTTFLFTNGVYPFPIISGFEYEIEVPGANTVARVTDIEETNSKQKTCLALDGESCYNELKHYRVNGVLNTVRAIYIHK